MFSGVFDMSNNGTVWRSLTDREVVTFAESCAAFQVEGSVEREVLLRLAARSAHALADTDTGRLRDRGALTPHRRYNQQGD